MSCTEVRPLFYWQNEERCASQQMYCDMGRSRGMAILRGATCSARHYHTLTLGYTTCRWRGIHTYTLLIFPNHLLPAQYPRKLTDFSLPGQSCARSVAVRGLWLPTVKQGQCHAANVRLMHARSPCSHVYECHGLCPDCITNVKLTVFLLQAQLLQRINKQLTISGSRYVFTGTPS